MNAIALLSRDHRDVEKLFARFEESDPEARRPVLEDIIRQLSVHAAIEEAHVYPVVATLDGGDEMVAEATKEHQAVKVILARLDSAIDKAHTKEVSERVARLKRDVAHHVKEEEGEVFPKLESSLTKTRLEELGRELKHAKDNAPTRPHPNQPPATELTGRANAIVDRVRDRVTGRS